MKKKTVMAMAMVSVLAVSQATGVLAANPSPDTRPHINTGSDSDQDLGESLRQYQERMGLTGSNSSGGTLMSSTSPNNDVLGVELGQSVTGQDGSPTLELVQGGGATAGLPEAVVNTINGINGGQDLSQVVPGVELSGYNALIGTHAIITREIGTNVEKLGSAQVPLYIPNLIDGLGTVQVLYFNNHTGRWELISPSRINTASKTLWVTIPGSGTLTVVYRR